MGGGEGTCSVCSFLTTCLLYARCPHLPADELTSGPVLISIDWTKGTKL